MGVIASPTCFLSWRSRRRLGFCSSWKGEALSFRLMCHSSWQAQSSHINTFPSTTLKTLTSLTHKLPTSWSTYLVQHRLQSKKASVSSQDFYSLPQVFHCSRLQSLLSRLLSSALAYSTHNLHTLALPLSFNTFNTNDSTEEGTTPRQYFIPLHLTSHCIPIPYF